MNFFHSCFRVSHDRGFLVMSSVNDDREPLFKRAPLIRSWFFLASVGLSFVIAFVALIVASVAMGSASSSPSVSSVFFSSSSSPVVADRVVSLNANGQLVAGAGLSLTLDLPSIYTEGKVSHLQVVSLLGGSAVIASSNNGLLVGRVAADDSVSWKTDVVDVGFPFLDGIVALSDSTFVCIHGNSTKSGVLRIDLSVQLGPAAVFVPDVTVEPVLKRVSDSSFVVSYFCSTGICGVVGSVASSMSITFGQPVTWSPLNHDFHDVIAFNSSAVAFFCNMDNVSAPSPSPLAVTVATVSPAGQLLTGPQVVLPSSFLIDDFFDVIAVSNSTAVACFPDASAGEDVACLALRFFSSSQVGILSSLRLRGFGSDAAFQFLFIQPLTEFHFAVLANNGRFAFALCALHGHVLTQVESVLELSSIQNNWNNNSWWIATTAISPTRFAILYTFEPRIGARVVLGTLLPPAVGYSVSPSVVASAGVISPKSLANNVVVGAEYYSDSLGRLVQGRFYGNAAGIANAPLVLSNGNIYLQRIGVGVSQSEIMLWK
jgi:hypothetical protein